MGLDVTGGVGGVGAALEDLGAAAARLLEVAGEVTEVVAALLTAGVGADLVTVALTRPVDAARVGAELGDLAGPTGLTADAAALLALAVSVRAAVATYAAGEEAVTLLVESAQDTAVLALSRQPVALGAAVAAADWAGLDVAAAADRLLFVAPWLADLAGGVEGVFAGPATPFDYEDGLALLAGAAAGGGLLTEAGHRVEVVPVGPVSPVSVAPAGLADLVGMQAGLEGPGDEPDRVRVVQVPQADGSSAWLVVVPGTQAWSPRAGPNPADLTSDVLLMAQRETLLAAGVEEALERAQGSAGRQGLGDAVLLAGHSQGGIVAATLAADPGFRRRQHVTHVVTSGAPIARLPLPPGVSVLALEHRQDAVPRLEGEANRDRRQWVTVTRDLREGTLVRTAGASHAGSLYRETAALADASGSRSLAAWRDGSRAFFAGAQHGPVTVRDFRVERVGPAP